MRGNIQGLVFDMDGTLVDNMHFHHQAWKTFLQSQGVEISDEAFHQKNVGTITEIIPRFLPHAQETDLIMELGRQKEAIYRSLYGPHIQPLPGLLEFLHQAYDAGIPMALATAADLQNIHFTLEGLGIGHFFDAITGSEEVRRGKPDPDVYLISARKLGLDPAHCMAFEDTPSGIRAAIAAGMQVVGLTTSHTESELSTFHLYKMISDYRSIHLNEFICV